jgi:hypothetical protein
MGLMDRIFGSPWGLLAMSTAIALASGIAIVGFGAPPRILVWVTYGMAAVFAPLAFRADRHREGSQRR